MLSIYIEYFLQILNTMNYGGVYLVVEQSFIRWNKLGNHIAYFNYVPTQTNMTDCQYTCFNLRWRREHVTERRLNQKLGLTKVAVVVVVGHVGGKITGRMPCRSAPVGRLCAERVHDPSRRHRRTRLHRWRGRQEQVGTRWRHRTSYIDRQW